MVQYILNFAANKDGCVVRMLNTVDSEGDTVNLWTFPSFPNLYFQLYTISMETKSLHVLYAATPPCC
jgi:hypothetical protein